MQEVWQFVSPKKRLISVLLLNFPLKINWKWFVFVVRGQKYIFFFFRACSSVVLKHLHNYANYAARNVIILIYPIISLFEMKVYFIYFLNMYGLWGFVVNNKHGKHLC